MASRSSPSTHSKRTSMRTPSERSRSELPRQGGSGNASSGPEASSRSPKDKKHKSLAEVHTSGRQSDQGDRPGAGSKRSRSGK